MHARLVSGAGWGAASLMYQFAALLGAACAILGLVLLVVFTPWLSYRLNANLHRLGVNETMELMKPGWAAAWYFVPIANLIIPVRVLGQIWRGTFTLADETGKDSFAALWWIALIVSGALGNWSDRLAGDAIQDPSIPLPRSSLITGIISDATMLASCAFMWLTFRALVSAQRDIIAARAHGAGPIPA
jgi:hypothetical protein